MLSLEKSFEFPLLRDYQETLHQSQEQMEGAQAILDSSQVIGLLLVIGNKK